LVADAAADLFLLVAVAADVDPHHLKLVAAVAASDADHHHLQLAAAAECTLVAVGHHYLSLVAEAAAADLSPLVAVVVGVYHSPLIAAAVATLWARSGVCTPWLVH